MADRLEQLRAAVRRTDDCATQHEPTCKCRPMDVRLALSLIEGLEKENRLLWNEDQALREYKNRRGKKPFGLAKRAWLDVVKAMDAVTAAESAKPRRG
jgi:hypothetical protein